MKYLEELEKFIEIMSEISSVPDYFTQQFLDFKQEQQGEKLKKVGIIGDNFYSLYVRAYGLKPILLGGGSYFTGEHTDMFPQISDPVAKASVGLLLDPENNLLEELDAVLIVANNDSYKKTIAYLKEMNIPVIQVEPIPYIREGKPFALYRQQFSVLNDISKVGYKLFNSSVFKKAVASYTRAYEMMEEESFQSLPTIVQSFFTYVLHTVWNKDEFCDELETYLEECKSEEASSKITVMGSFMHLPNYKLFKIFSDIGITHFQNECTGLPNYGELDLTSGSVFGNCIEFQHKSAFNSGTISNIDRVSLPKDTDGIVYYLLKGQTSQAYEAERIEELAIAQGVPFLCVETDYTYTDSEQMKIRIEAFYEMLSSNKRRAASA